MKPTKLPRLSLKKDTLLTLSSRQLADVAGGCTDDSSGNGLICGPLNPQTRKTIKK